MIRSRLKKRRQKKVSPNFDFWRACLQKAQLSSFVSVTCVCSRREKASARGQGPKAFLAPPPLQKSILDQSIEGARGLLSLCKEEVCTTCHLLCFLYYEVFRNGNKNRRILRIGKVGLSLLQEGGHALLLVVLEGKRSYHYHLLQKHQQNLTVAKVIWKSRRSVSRPCFSVVSCEAFTAAFAAALVNFEVFSEIVSPNFTASSSSLSAGKILLTRPN